MADPYRTKTKEVKTYGRRGNRNIISIHHDFSPARPSGAVSGRLSPTNPLKRPPLTSKSSEDCINIPQAVSPPAEKAKAAAIKPVNKAHAAPRISTSPSDSPRLIRRMHRPGRAVIPASPASCAAASPTPAKSASSRFDGVEIPVPRRRKARPQVIIIDSDSDIDGDGDISLRLEELSIAVSPAKSPSPTRCASGSLASVCSHPDVQPFDGILTLARSVIPGSTGARMKITKVGEASYSEVFSLQVGGGSAVVMKVIPIVDEAKDDQSLEEEMPFCSLAADVAKEVEITKRMSELEGGGFIPFIGANIVQGHYPKSLLNEWDRFNRTHRSDNVRPACLGAEQRYVVIFLRDGGDDLETFKFDARIGCIQAAGVFWQVADALARAEVWAEFEHRDLHDGQILLEPCQVSLNHPLNPLEPSSSGIRATIIDFGLSRVRAADGNRVISTPISQDVIDGVGAQWDVYKAIDARLGGDWAGYHPITNLMWLQFIANLLLSRTKPKKQPRTAQPALPTSTDQDGVNQAAHTALQIVKGAIDATFGKRGRRLASVGNVAKGDFGSASELMKWARERGDLYV